MPLFVGDPQKLRERTGWKPGIPLVLSLRDVYAAASATRESAGMVIKGSDGRR